MNIHIPHFIKKSAVLLALALIAFLSVNAKDILKTGINPVSVTLDGKKIQSGWSLLTGDTLDVLNTKAREIVFMSDIDTLKIELDEWQTRDFDIITDDGKKASVRVKRQSENVYERPDPELIKRSPSGLLGKKQAEFDIRALVYALSEIHPDMFSVCRQEEFFTLVNKAIQTLPDSVSTLELYRRLAPVVAALGDGHTNLGYPYNDVFTDELRQMPFSFKINSDMSAVCSVCIDSIIPAGSKILSINGRPMEALIEEMLPYVAGEKKPFRISRLNYDFSGLHLMLHPTDRYEVVYLPEDSKEPLTANLEGGTYNELKKRLPARKKKRQNGALFFQYRQGKECGHNGFPDFPGYGRYEKFRGLHVPDAGRGKYR